MFRSLGHTSLTEFVPRATVDSRTLRQPFRGLGHGQQWTPLPQRWRNRDRGLDLLPLANPEIWDAAERSAADGMESPGLPLAPARLDQSLPIETSSPHSNALPLASPADEATSTPSVPSSAATSPRNRSSRRQSPRSRASDRRRASSDQPANAAREPLLPAEVPAPSLEEPSSRTPRPKPNAAPILPDANEFAKSPAANQNDAAHDAATASPIATRYSGSTVAADFAVDESVDEFSDQSFDKLSDTYSDAIVDEPVHTIAGTAVNIAVDAVLVSSANCSEPPEDSTEQRANQLAATTVQSAVSLEPSPESALAFGPDPVDEALVPTATLGSDDSIPFPQSTNEQDRHPNENTAAASHTIQLNQAAKKAKPQKAKPVTSTSSNPKPTHRKSAPQNSARKATKQQTHRHSPKTDPLTPPVLEAPVPETPEAVEAPEEINAATTAAHSSQPSDPTLVSAALRPNAAPLADRSEPLPSASPAQEQPSLSDPFSEETNLPLQGFSTGGLVQTTHSPAPTIDPTDTVPAMLSPGEFVVNREATQKHLPLLHHLNQGGILPDAAPSTESRAETAPAADSTLGISSNSLAPQPLAALQPLIAIDPPTDSLTDPPTEAASPSQYSPPALIFRPAAPPLPRSPSSLEELVQLSASWDSAASTADSDPFPATSTSVVRGFAQDGIVSEPSPSPLPSPAAASAAAPTAAEIAELPLAVLDTLAQEIYARLQERLIRERERQGGYSRRLLW